MDAPRTPGTENVHAIDPTIQPGKDYLNPEFQDPEKGDIIASILAIDPSQTHANLRQMGMNSTGLQRLQNLLDRLCDPEFADPKEPSESQIALLKKLRPNANVPDTMKVMSHLLDALCKSNKRKQRP